MIRSMKLKNKITEQKVNSLDEMLQRGSNDLNVLVDNMEDLLLQSQMRSSHLCSKTLKYPHYLANPPKDLIVASGKALASLGRLRVDQLNVDILNEIEGSLLKMQSDASYASSIKNSEISSTGTLIIKDCGCALALLGRLRVVQNKMANPLPAVEENDNDEQVPEEDNKDDDTPVPQLENPDDQEPVIGIFSDDDMTNNNDDLIVMTNPHDQ